MHVAFGLSIEKTLNNLCHTDHAHTHVQVPPFLQILLFFYPPPPPPSTFLNGRVDNQDDISAIPVLTWVITID